MSNMNSNQLFRRNGSPSVSKQGPIRATKQFGLSSPSRVRPKSRSNADKSPVAREPSKARTRPLSETCILSEQERASPSSPVTALKAVDKPRVSATHRSNSLENLMGPYLAGHWPKDGQWLKEPIAASNATPTISYTGAFTADKHTQTPESWTDLVERRKAKAQSLPYKRAQSIGSGDQFKSIKHKLQRNGSHSSCSYQPRLSPSLVASNSASTQSTAATTVTQPIKIPTNYSNQIAMPPRGTPGKARASVEGLNQEVEKLIISGRVCDNMDEPTSNVDGHRAPIVELLTRTTDTQTPSEPPQFLADSSLHPPSKDLLPIMLEVSEVMAERCERSSSQSSEDVSHSFSGTEDSDDRCLSVSPSFIPGQFDMEEVTADLPLKDHSLEKKLTVSSSTSPCPNSAFIREPPDGAERVKCMDEMSSAPVEVKHSMPVGNVHLLPSATSAFGLPSAAKQTSSHAAPIAKSSSNCSTLI